LASHADCKLSLTGKRKKYEKELEDLARDVKALADEYRRRGMAPAKAEKSAAAEVLRVKIKRKEQAILAAEAKISALADLQLSEDGMGAGLMAMLVRPLKDGVTGKLSIEELRQKHIARAHATMAAGLDRLQSKWFGLSQDRAFLTDVGLEIHGKATGNAEAAAIAASWRKAAEELRIKFNRLGGDIKSRVDWGLKQMHDAEVIRKAGREAWVDHTAPLVDGEKMREAILAILAAEDRAHEITDDELREALGTIYDNIVTGGASSRTTAVKNRHLSPRVIAFKDADSWHAYNNRFGVSDIFSTMMSHVDELSQEIASMERLGPNPRALFDELMDEVKTGGYGGRKIPMFSELSSDQAKEAMLESVARQVFGEDRAATGVIAHAFQGTRNLITSAVLGGATLSSFADLGTAALTAGFNRMGVTKTILRQLKTVFQDPKSGAMDVAAARRMGIIIDAASARVRLAHETSGVGISSKMSEFTIRASGLSWWTDMNKVGFGMSMAADMADAFDRSFAEADAGFGGMFSRYNWREADWDALRSVGAWDYKGSKFASMERVLASDLDDATKDRLAGLLVATINGETRFAIPEPSNRTLGLLRGRSERGTIAGELRRSFFLFKSFAVEMANGHGSRLFFQASNGDRLKYAAGLIGATTIMGAMSYQLKAISRGREPVDMTQPGFWGAALMQGGGLGLMGDFLVSAGGADRFGHSFVVSQAGPLAGLADDVARMVGGATTDAMGGDDLGPSARTIKTIGRYVPGSSLWYLRAAYERGLIDNLRAAVDPVGARRSFRSEERFYKEQFGQGFIIRPGAFTP
jgi:hypothetical protein